MVIVKYLNELLATVQDHVPLRILRCGHQNESNYGNVVMRILKDYDKDAQIEITAHQKGKKMVGKYLSNALSPQKKTI